MALDSDKLKAQEALKELSDEQIKAIAELSTNDENEIIGKKIGEIYGNIDRDVQETLGLEKPAGVKTYDWLKSDILPKVKESSATAKKLTDAEQKVKDLEKKIEEGASDEQLKTQLKDAKDRADRLSTQLEDEKKTYQQKLEEAQGNMTKMQVNNEMDKGLAGLKFQDEKVISSTVRNKMIEVAKQAITGKYQADWIDDGNGGRQMVFRDDKGNILRNPNNKQHPYTAQELLKAELKDILLDQKQKKGTGGAGGEGGGGEDDPADAPDVTGLSQVQADEKIKKHLMAKGLERGTPEFTENFSKIRKALGVSSLKN